MAPTYNVEYIEIVYQKSYKRHLPKCPSKNPNPLVQNNFYTFEDSEEEIG